MYFLILFVGRKAMEINMTKKLYDKDAYLKEFTAVVQLCEKAENGYDVILDQTAFFPEGGGQAADGGTIDGIKVIDVQEKGGAIIHTIEEPLENGQEVSCALDWETRFSRMQAHSGEHIVSGVVHSTFGYSNVGFHMSDELMTVTFDGVLTPDDIIKVEIESNRAVYRNLEIKAINPSKEELEKLEFRSKIELGDDARIVIIGDVDSCACCAPHVARTGEIGLIKIVNSYAYKQGTRIEMLAGSLALFDYINLNTSNKELMALLSASRKSVNEAVIKQNEQLIALRTQNAQMSKELAFLKLNPVSAGDGAYAITKDLSFDELRYCSNNLLDKGIKTCVLLSQNSDGVAYVVSSKTEDVREIVKTLNEKFKGKGGGKPDYAQGKLADCNEEELKATIKEMLK